MDTHRPGDNDDIVIGMLKTVTDTPREWRTTPDSTLALGRRFQRRRRLGQVGGAIGLVAFAVFGVVSLPLPGSAINDVVVATAPDDGKAHESGTTDSPEGCPPTGGRAGTPELDAAVDEVTKLGTSDSRRGHFTNLSVCGSTNTLFVYRVPGDDELDAATAASAMRHGVVLHLLDARYSLKTLEEAAAAVVARRPELAARGADVIHMSKKHGWLEVGVQGNLPVAREILSDLGEKIRVVEGVEVVTTPGVKSTADWPSG